MATPSPFQSRWTRLWTAGIVILSLALHGTVLTPLALNLFGSPPQRPVVRSQPPIYVDIQPRPAGFSRPQRAGRNTVLPFREVDRSPARPSAGQAVQVGPRRPTSSSDLTLPAIPPVAPDDAWRVQPDDTANRIGTALRRSSAGCRTLADRLNAAEQAHCDRLFAEGAAGARPISGTDDPVRDARFAAAGAQALADYERRRAPLKPGRDLPCPHGTDIMGGCPVRVMVPIWSSTDGFLPGLKRDE